MALRMMRENIRKFHWVLWIVIASFVLVYGYDYVQQREAPEAQPVLKVNGQEVPLIEVQRSLQAMSRFFQNQQPEQRKLLVNMILDSMINQILLNQLADRLGIVVTEEEANEVLRQQISALKNQVKAQNPDISEDELDQQVQAFLQNALVQQGYASLMDYRDEIIRSIRAQKVQQILGAPITVSPEEIRDFYEKEYVTVRFEYVHIRPDRYRAPQATEEELKAYYEAHRDRYMDKEKRRAEIYRIPIEAFISDIKVPEEEIKAYYEQHKDEFTEPPRVHARHILISTGERTPEEALQIAQELLDRIRNGEDFATLARTYSEDPGTRDQGGDLGWFSRGRMVKTFEDACFAAREGAVVGPIQTGFGYHIIQVLEKDPGGLQPLDKVRDIIVRKLAEPEARKKAESLAREIATALKSGTPIDAVNQKDRVKKETTPLFDVDTDTVPFAIRQSAFKLQNAGDTSEIIPLDDGYAVIRILEIRTPVPLAFESARNQVLQDWQEAKKLELAMKDAQELVRIAKEHQGDLKTAAEQLGFDLEEAGPLSRKDPFMAVPVKADFVQQLWQQPVQEVMGPISLAENGVLVYKITERHEFDEKDLKEKERSLKLRIIAQKRNLILQNIIKKLKEKAKIQRNEQLIQQLVTTG